MIAPITALSRALKTPYIYFRAQLMMLLTPRAEHLDTPAVICVENYAEALVMLAYGQRAFIYMPLTEGTSEQLAETVRWIRRTSTPIFDDCQFYRGDLLYFDENNERCRADVALLRLPEGEFLNMPQSHSKQRLRQMLDELQLEMKRLNITHTNLTPDSIIVGAHGMHITRIHQIRRGVAKTNFRPLYNYIDRMNCEFTTGQYREWQRETSSPIDRAYGLQEERVRIVKNGKYGFADVHQNILVSPKYLWVEDYVEGRALVRSEEGAGVIDLEGKIVVPTIYENIVFDVNNAMFYAMQDGSYTYYNYNGDLFDALDQNRFGPDKEPQRGPRELYNEVKKEERKLKRQQKREIEKLLCKKQNV